MSFYYPSSPDVKRRVLPRPISRRSKSRAAEEPYASSSIGPSESASNDDDTRWRFAEVEVQPEAENIEDQVYESYYDGSECYEGSLDMDSNVVLLENGEIGKGYLEYGADRSYGNEHTGEDNDYITDCEDSRWSKTNRRSNEELFTQCYRVPNDMYTEKRGTRPVWETGRAGSAFSSSTASSIDYRSQHRTGYSSKQIPLRSKSRTRSYNSIHTGASSTHYQSYRHEMGRNREVNSGSEQSDLLAPDSKSDIPMFTGVKSRRLTEKFMRESITVYDFPASSDGESTESDTSDLPLLDGRASTAPAHRPKSRPRAHSLMTDAESRPVSRMRAQSRMLVHSTSQGSAHQLSNIKGIHRKPPWFKLRWILLLFILIIPTLIAGMYIIVLKYEDAVIEQTLFNPTIATANAYGKQLLKIRNFMAPENIEVEEATKVLTWLLREVVIQTIQYRGHDATVWKKDLPFDWNLAVRPVNVEVDMPIDRPYNMDMFRKDGKKWLDVIEREAGFDFEGEGEIMVQELKDMWGTTVRLKKDTTMRALCGGFYFDTLLKLEKPMSLMRKERGLPFKPYSMYIMGMEPGGNIRDQSDEHREYFREEEDMTVEPKLVHDWSDRQRNSNIVTEALEWDFVDTGN